MAPHHKGLGQRALLLLSFILYLVMTCYGEQQESETMGGAPLVKGKWFDRILIFIFENHAYDEVIRNPDFNSFARLGTQFTNYYAVTHPSQPNYWCQTSGDHYNIASDNVFNLDKSNIVDLLDSKHVSWKAYMEDLPSTPCFAEARSGKYYRKHNPFVSYDNIRNNRTRCERIVNSQQFDVDLNSGNLPQYMYFTPNIDNDCHDTNITFGGKWLRGYLEPRLARLPRGTLVVITWDEDDYTEENKIDTCMFGSMVAPRSRDNTYYDHFSLLRTVEDNWELGTLGRHDSTAVPFAFQR